MAIPLILNAERGNAKESSIGDGTPVTISARSNNRFQRGFAALRITKL